MDLSGAGNGAKGKLGRSTWRFNLGVREIQIEGCEKFERIVQCPNCASRHISLMTTKQ
jgi:hypothetical protein